MNTSDMDCLLSSMQTLKPTIPTQKIIRISMYGSASIGKSSLIMNFKSQPFDTAVPSGDASHLVHHYGDLLQNVRIFIHETNCVSEMVLGFATVSVHVFGFALDDRPSFDDLDRVLKLVKCADPGFASASVLVGYKEDSSLNRAITTDEAQEYANIHNIPYYIETSAKNGLNISKVIDTCVELATKNSRFYHSHPRRLMCCMVL
eukprot:TRINITY_DN9259_c1_g1_i2.p1 TRINITY_DN9259_c1_g1~~TRINITY_DN9259_c1_g1_i2.p1  ORF type:complete len:204 (-),score=23.52 TRINITY_DN9259_c1_g1_i2:15-626(-)